MRAKMVPFLIFLFLCQRISAAEDPQVVTAKSGQKNFTLTCRAPNNSKDLIGVDWRRDELGSEYVLLYRDEQFVTDHQHPSFKDRVDLNDRQMKDGDVSLILKEVFTTDGGTYECRVLIPGPKREKRAAKTISSIYLRVVVPPGQIGGDTEDGGNEDGSVGLTVGLLVPAVLLVAVVGFVVIYIKKKSQGLYQHPSDLFHISSI